MDNSRDLVARLVAIVAISAKEALNVEDLCTITGWSRNHVYSLTSERKIPHYKPFGKEIFFKKSEVTDWLLRNKIYSKTEIEEEADRRVNGRRRS